MASEVLIVCGTIGLAVAPDYFGGGMIALGIIGAILRYENIPKHNKKN